MTAAVSVCTTVFNSAADVDLLMSDLAKQEVAFDYEVVVADGGSTDDTARVLERWAAELPAGRLRTSTVAGNISRGRNHAISEATAPIVVTVDAGVRLQPDWLSAMSAPLLAGTARSVAGSFEPAPPTTFWQGVINAVITPPAAEFTAGTVLPSARSSAFFKEDFEAVGGYPEDLDHTEDLVLYQRLHDRVGPPAWNLSSPVTWDGRSTLPALFEQYSNYARGDAMARIYLKRNAARYVFYGVLVGATASRHPAARALQVAQVGRLALRPVQRIAAHPTTALGPATVPAALAVQVVGDVGKMLGYAKGLKARRQ